MKLVMRSNDKKKDVTLNVFLAHLRFQPPAFRDSDLSKYLERRDNFVRLLSWMTLTYKTHKANNGD